MRKANSFLAIILVIVLCTVLCVPVYASSGFNAGLDIVRSEGEIAVTVQDSEVLHQKQPSLTIPCDVAFEGAKVLFEGVASTISYAEGQLTFKVAKGGTYYIVAGMIPAETLDATCTHAEQIIYEHKGSSYVETGEPAAGHDFTDTSMATCANCSEPNPDYVKPEEPGDTPPAEPPANPPVVPPVMIPTTPSEPGVETEKTTNPDGSTTTTTTDTATGTVTETTENVDGSTTEVKTESDGTVTTTNINTITETNEDGATATIETTVEEKVEADGTTTSTSTTATTTTAADGAITVETKVEEVVKTGTTTTATTTTTTETAEKKETVEEKVETVVAEDGTETTTTTKKTETELADGTKATTNVSAEGTVTAEAEIPAEVAQSGETVTLPIPAVPTTKDSAAAATITVTTNTTENTTIEVPVENVSAGTVLVIVEEDGTETVVTETKLTENGVVADLPDGATVKVVDNSKDFSDVEEDDWYKDAVDFVSARGIVSGMTEEEYGHNDTATRAMLWTMLARMDGVDTTVTDGNWYEIGQQWAMENGVSDGTNPNDVITREQLVTMLWRYVGEPESDHDISHFNDHHETSDWAYTAKQWGNENGIINGMGGRLNPQGETTRAQLAQFIKNFIENM